MNENNLNLNELSDKLDAYTKHKNELDTLLKKDGSSAIGKAFQNVLNGCPGVGVNWNQYVPGFNDGDPCHFTVGEFYIYLLEHGDKSIDDCSFEEMAIFEEDGKISRSDYPNSDIPVDISIITVEQYNELESIWHKLDNHILETVFGENTEVTITSEDVTVEDYDCGH